PTRFSVRSTRKRGSTALGIGRRWRRYGSDTARTRNGPGFRILARRDGAGVRLITRHGNDFAERFPLVASAAAALPARSCLIDGEAIVCDENGLAVFDLIRGHGSKTSAVLCAFDLPGTRRKGFAATPHCGVKRPIGTPATQS